MSRPPEELVCRYLDGSASAHEVRLLDEALQGDRQVARLLVDMAALDTHLMRAIQQERGAATLTAEDSREVTTTPAATLARRRQSATPAWRIWAAAAAVAASVFLTTAGWLHSTRPQSPEPQFAQVLRLHGAAYRFDTDGRLTPINVGDLLRPGDMITTGAFPICCVTAAYPDGTRVQFEHSTQATILDLAGSRRVRLHRGAVSADVASDLPGHEMVIATADCQVKGLQARLTVQKEGDNNETRLSVAKGQVEFNCRADRAQHMVTVDQDALVGGGFKFVTRVEFLYPPIVDPPRQIRIPSEIQYAWSVAFDGTGLWVANGGRDYYMGPRNDPEKRFLFKIHPQDGVVIDALDLGAHCGINGAAGLAWDGKYLWVADVYQQKILQVDPNRRPGLDPVIGVIPAEGKSIEQIAVSESDLWGLGKGRGRRDDVVYKYDTVHQQWSEEAPLVIPPTLDGYYAIACLNGSLYLHVLGPGVAGRIYKLDSPGWEDKPAVFRGSEPGARVQAMSYDPQLEEWWIISRDWGWIRPMPVISTEPAKDKPGVTIPLMWRGQPNSQRPFAASRHERSLPCGQSAESETGWPQVATNVGESLTLFGPQLESKIVPNKKALPSLNLHQGWVAPPLQVPPSGSHSGTLMASNTNRCISFVRRKGSIHA